MSGRLSAYGLYCRHVRGLKLEGARSEKIVLAGKDLSSAGKVVELAPDVPKTALSKLANYVD